MNILIIGSEGFIGGFLIKTLQEKGHTIKGMDIRREEDRQEKYAFRSGNIMNADDLAGAMEGCDCVINLAAKHHDFGISREEFFEINEQGTKNILEAMKERGVNKLVFFSSVAVYGNVEDRSSEQSPVNPANDYGESKLAAEKLIGQWAEEDTSREALIIRPAVVFGENNYANMFKLIDTIYKRRYVPVGKGDNVKSACYAGNLADMTCFVMSKMHPGVEVYNYSDYDHLTSKEVIEIIYRALGRRPPRFHIPLVPVLVVTSVIDLIAKITGINFAITSNRIKKLNMRTAHGSDKVRSEGFEQKVSLEEGLKRMVSWYLEKEARD